MCFGWRAELPDAHGRRGQGKGRCHLVSYPKHGTKHKDWESSVRWPTIDPIRKPSKYPNKKHFKGPNNGELSSNPLGKNPSDVWDIPNVKSNHVEKTDYPCQFPIGLVERLVLALTNEGGSVLDPYLGVGSSAIAALKNGRHAYGCDLDRGYVDIAWERIHQLRAGTIRTRPMNKPVYDPNE